MNKEFVKKANPSFKQYTLNNLYKASTNDNLNHEIGGQWKLNNDLVFSNTCASGFVRGLPCILYNSDNKSVWHLHHKSVGWWPSYEDILSSKYMYPNILVTRYGVWIYHKTVAKLTNVKHIVGILQNLHHKLEGLQLDKLNKKTHFETQFMLSTYMISEAIALLIQHGVVLQFFRYNDDYHIQNIVQYIQTLLAENAQAKQRKMYVRNLLSKRQKRQKIT